MPLTWLKTLSQLGFKQTGLFALYQASLKSGYLLWRTAHPARSPGSRLEIFLPVPEPGEVRALLGIEGESLLYQEAGEIISGQVRLFGGKAVELELKSPAPLLHWTRCREQQLGEQQDIKFVWEPGRFGWAITLARAYFLKPDERYADSFWRYTEIFLNSNPAYRGFHWVSAQEVAIRLTALVFASQIFASSPSSTPERLSRLAESIAQHAHRIPPTLAYARAQNNNHLLTEAMGLITAACALPAHARAKKWFSQGWKWFHQGIKTQIAADGSYNQHSTNYHRLMLQTALWTYLLARNSGRIFPELSSSKLSAATRWLLALCDPLSGSVPNLGPNDGAYLFPLSILPFQDFRPVLQAAGKAFLGEEVLPVGNWDEMSMWFCPDSLPSSTHTGRTPFVEKPNAAGPSPQILKSSGSSWAYLRTAQFTSRPGHADQLHLDVWWRGLNITVDPGTYRYNAPAPWENALTSTLVHNTLSINEEEQMSRVGRFLYLDWAQGEVLSCKHAQDGRLEKMVAQHQGYRRFGIIHQRTVSTDSDVWKIEDLVLPLKPTHQPSRIRLHWLLPDWEWKLNPGEAEAKLEVLSPFGWIELKTRLGHLPQPATSLQKGSLELVRAGKFLYPPEKAEISANPTRGWISPTYGFKVPALSFSVNFRECPPLTIVTHLMLPQEK